MKLKLLVAALFALSAPAAPLTAAPPTAAPPTAAVQLKAPAPLSSLVSRVEIPNERFVLPNGLTVIVHTDRKAPLVHVGVWYDVGSVDEPVGRSGFAHLFEHLMFYGTAHHKDDHFKPLEAIGATDFNGTTSFDRTNYFQTVPTPALELALFLESDRMGHLLPALTQEKLDAQRKVVLNEKREGDNQPGGLVQYAMLMALFPQDHPMSLSTIGRVEDLNAATLKDAQAWFRDHYGPNNAVLVLAGDIDVKTARPLVENYFGQIAAGPTPGRFKAPLPERATTTRATMHDKIAEPQLMRFWVGPPRGSKEAADLQIAMVILANGQTARLQEALVRQERLAVSVGGSYSGMTLAGLASLEIETAPGVDIAKAEARVDALLAEFLKNGPTKDEVDRVAMRAVSGTVRGLEKIGGFGGKGVALAEGQLYAGDPSDYRRDLAQFAAATPESVRTAAQKWLSRGDHRISLLPGERNPKEISPPAGIRIVVKEPKPAIVAEAVGTPVDRTKGPPPAGPATEFNLPKISHARLSNGLEVMFAKRDAVPVTRMTLSLPVGIAGDDRQKPGTQNMMLGLLDEGTNGRLGPLDGPEIAKLGERLGLGIGASAALDRTRISMNAISSNLEQSITLFADIVRHPAFPPDQLERLRVQALTGLRQEETDPASIAYRALPPLVYGAAHPYGQSFSGSGTDAGLKAITRDDLVRFHQQAIRPEGATLFIVGDTSLEQIKPMLERAFGDWNGVGAPPKMANAPAIAQPTGKGRIILYDRPDSPQSVIRAASALALTGKDDVLPLSLANDVFGGLSSARLNQELREKRNWSYGAYSSVSATRLQMPFIVTTSVETPQTAASITEIRRLLTEFRSKSPPTADEIARARANTIRTLPGDFETGGALLSALDRNRSLGRPDDYLETLVSRLEAVPEASVASAPIPAPDDLVWVIVGDAKAIGASLKALGLPMEVRPLTPVLGDGVGVQRK